MMFIISKKLSSCAILVSLFCEVTGHSWTRSPVGDLGAGTARWEDDGSHQNLKREWCPPEHDPSACEAFYASHNIAVGGDIERPCQPGKSATMAKVSVGGNLHVVWPFNGHNKAEADGTCVELSVTPYASDPASSDFTGVGSCAPFYNPGESIGGTDVTIPSSYGPGQYTMLWNWHFADIWYGSCLDFEVVGSSSSSSGGLNVVAQQPATSSPTSTSASRGCTTNSADDDSTTNTSTTSSSNSGGSSNASYLANGCGSLGDSYCESRLGAQSYCKTGNPDDKGRFVCFGDNHSMLNARLLRNRRVLLL